MEGTGPPPQIDWEAPDLEGSWKRFLEHAEFIFAGPLSKKTEEEKCNYLMIWVGEKGRKIYRTWDLSDDDRKKLKTYKDKFSKYVKPRSNVVYNRYKFSSRVQNEGEPFEQFVTDLQVLVRDCQYDKSEEMVRDRVVFGVRNGRIREKLIQVGSELTLEKTLDIARAYEVSKTQTKSMSLEHETESVNAVHKWARAKKKDNRNISNDKCSRCGNAHAKNKCPAFGKQCAKCQRYNHFASECHTSASAESSRPKEKNRQKRYTKSKSKRVNQLEEHSNASSDEDLYVGVVYDVNSVNSDWSINADVSGKTISMRVDTGAQCNVMSVETYNTLGLKGKLEKTDSSTLKSYSGHKLPVAGTRNMRCKVKGQYHKLKFYIVDLPSETLLGCESSEKLQLVKRICSVPLEKDDIMKRYPTLFTGLGKLPGTLKIVIDKTVTPVVHAPRKVPVALKEKVKEELASMEKKGVIYKQTKPTAWVNSMVTVVKPNGKLRICMDPKDLNKAIMRQHHPMKTVEEILPRIANAIVFSKLDASCGFWQCALDDDSQELCTMNTPFGRYSFKRLPYGIKSAPEVYQKKVSELIQDLNGCESIVDDIIIWGENVNQHDERLYKVLDRLDEKNMKLNKDKCEFRKTSLTYVGHVLTDEGLKPDEEKVRAVKDMKQPENVKELMTFLGFVNYLGKFIPNLSDKSAPLRKLLEKDIHWHWDKEESDAFEILKDVVTNAPVLKYYDQKEPVTLSVDASSKGLGAVILQNGQPVAFGSRALTTAQQNYAQIEKEALAIAYGCTKFHQYLFGREIHVESDHRPLQAIFAKQLYQTPPRLQRILLSLQKYDLKVRYKPGKEMYISDCLSRAYLNETKENLNSEELTVNLLTYLPVSTEKRKTFQKETANDPELNELRNHVDQGWPEKRDEVSPQMRLYWNFRDEVTCIDGMMFKGHKLIVPKRLRPEMLNLIHEAHTGIVKCKARARETLFWIGMSADVETKVSQCETCVRNQNKNQKEPLIKTEIPNRPWSKISVDLFHLNGHDYLLTVDKFSSWPELAKLDNLSSKNTICYLKSQFSRYGIPDEVQSDNGVQFASHHFKEFQREYGFQHVTSSPTYAQSNGLVERGVQTVKSLLKKAKDPYKSLMIYRDTAMEDTGLSPAQMFLGRRLKTTLPVTSPLLQPQQPDSNKVHMKKTQSQGKQKFYFDKNCGKQLSNLQEGERVVMKRDQNQKHWEPATVIRKHDAPRSYVIEQDNGHRFRRNRKHLRPTKAKFDTSDRQVDNDSVLLANEPSVETPLTNAMVPNTSTTRSGRAVKLPEKYSDYVVDI